MVRTLFLAVLVTLFGTTVSVAQYRDSAPSDDYASRYETESTYDEGDYDDYDEELLGSPDYRGYSEPDIDVGIFGSLGSDGSWYFAADFGWVWRPYARAGWRPYSDGRWVYTSYGWTWVSYEPYGWATYHYGYWARDPFLGWVWIPGYEWSACRVRFAYYDDYISWTPLPPPGYHCPQPWSTVGISVWFTIGARHFCDPYPSRYYVTPKYKTYYAERVAYKAPERHFVERYTGSPVRTTSVEFKHKSWSKVDRSTAKYNGGAKYQGGSKHATKPDRTVMKSRAQKSGTQYVAPRNSTRSGSYAMRSTPRMERESRVARTERTSKQQFKGQSAREQRSIQKPQRAERSSRSSMQVSRNNSGERKANYSSKKPDRRNDAAKSKRSESGGKSSRKAK